MMADDAITLSMSQLLSGGEAQLAAQLPRGSSGSGGSSTARLKELMEEVETLKAERAVMESELRGTNPDMQSVFLAAAAAGSLNEPNISLSSLGRTFGPLQHQVALLEEPVYLSFPQVTDSIGKQEKIIAEVQDLYQPFIQVPPTAFRSTLPRSGAGRGAAGRRRLRASRPPMMPSWSSRGTCRREPSSTTTSPSCWSPSRIR
jgi:hypothetical protein